MKQHKLLTGQTIGNYYFLDVAYTKNRKRHYNVVCKCGKKVIRSKFSAEKESGKYCRCDDNQNSIDICCDQIYYRYLCTTKHRNKKKKISLEFNLSKEDVRKLILNNCFYCNKLPSNIITVYKHKLNYNGIDRLNNDLGYIKNNCVTCCWECNESKRSRSFLEFKNWINRVYNNINSKGESKLE
jgi:hypothetical protein